MSSARWPCSTGKRAIGTIGTDDGLRCRRRRNPPRAAAGGGCDGGHDAAGRDPEGAHPGLLVGRHLPARGKRPGARAVPGEALAAHAHPARPRHLRRGRHGETHHRRRRCQRRRAVPGLQPGDAIRDRRAGHARRRGPRRDRHRQRQAGGLRTARSGPARSGRSDPRGAPVKHTITLIAGDGIGPEVTSAVVEILERAGLDVEWDAHLAGVLALEPHGSTLPDELLDSIRRNKVALKGPVTTPVGEGFTSVNVGLRKALNLFVNLRPVWNIPSVASKYEGADRVIVGENTENLYSGLEPGVVPGVVESLKIITEEASTRVATFAFEYARKHHRRRVTAVHKANIMKMGDGLFLRSVRNVAARYPDIVCDDRIVDAACMHLVMKPAQFDILLLPNLYGDIVSDLCAGLVGGLGVVPGANLGTEIGVFEAVHGSAPDIAGKGIANPMALLLSAMLMLRHIGEGAIADRVVAALNQVLEEGTVRTRDLGGSAGTSEYADAICRRLVA